jgi:tetratricopeptide (TPR) repeat protein
MTFRTALRKLALVPAALVLLPFVPRVLAQEETKEEAMYREDYERFTKIKAIPDPMKRCDAFYDFLKQRPDSKLLKNAQAEYLLILEGVMKAQKYTELETLSERFIRLFPKVGETYYFYGAALQEAKKPAEAMVALAKCYLLKNPGSERAKQRLEFLYKAQNRGNLAGIEAIYQKARAELAK